MMKQHTKKKGVLCVDATSRVIFINSYASELVFSLFGCRLQPRNPLPRQLKECVVKLRHDHGKEQIPAATPILLERKNAAPVSVHLCDETDQAGDCLIFEEDGRAHASARLREMKLTPRQAEVVTWIMQNKTNWEIGRILGISSRTVDKHVQNIFVTLDVNNRVDLILKWQKSADQS
jgi:DNA-binding CsgD family transcriptional regulator